MASLRYKLYSKNKFKCWKAKVRNRLPQLVIKFYTAALQTNVYYIPYEMEVKLGSVIKDINNPFYTIMYSSGKRMSEEDVMAMEILLEIQVRELFEFVNTKLV